MNNILLEIDKKITDIKVEIHNLEKLGFDTKNLEKALDSFGIEVYKIKKGVKEYGKRFI